MNTLFLLFVLPFAYANTFCMTRFYSCFDAYAYTMNETSVNCEEIKLIWNCIAYPEPSCQKEYNMQNIFLRFCVHSDCGDTIDWCMAEKNPKCLTDHTIVIIVITVFGLGIVIVLFALFYKNKQKKKFENKLKEITETTRLIQSQSNVQTV